MRSHHLRRSLQNSLNVRKAAGSIVQAFLREIRRTAETDMGLQEGIIKPKNPQKMRLNAGNSIGSEPDGDL
jgi:hypothetical protein